MIRKPLRDKQSKGKQLELLPNIGTVNRLVGGDTAERSINNYAKVTPSGINALDAPDINEMNKVKF